MESQNSEFKILDGQSPELKINMVQDIKLRPELVDYFYHLKEQYPVTAHAPNFDFWTGCPEIKRCEESKRTLKNPFASRLAEFNTTLKLLRITDQ